MDKGEINFQRLTPIRDVELGAYKNALDFVFENDDIKNIAVSGAYSAGKSSILETYKVSNKNKKFIHISLAHFESPDRQEDNEFRSTLLEGKILNQLIHQIPPDNIPQTNFRVKRSVSAQRIWGSTFLIVSLLLLLFHVFFFDKWCQFATKLESPSYISDIINISTNNISQLISAFFIVSISVYFIKESLILYKNKNIFKKVSVQGAEIEIFEESEDSYFDKYLNEVLYLFENSGTDVIVFEDMDRYNANQIFERLREVNTLVNNHNAKHKKRILRFFYLLRDDIFTSKDRTKFFDYIIPVVPVIDGSNSYDTLLSLLISVKLIDIFDQKFLQGLSLYIDDMRILKNIFNEFLLYKEMLDTIELDPNKLLSIITYKNIFPRDFSDLQLGKGFVATIFLKKETFIYSEVERIKNEIKETEDTLEHMKHEHLVHVNEVDALYSPRIQTARNNWNGTQEVEKLINEADKRKKAIKTRERDGGEQLKAKIAALNDLLTTTYSKKLNKIISRENIDDIFKVVYIDGIGQEVSYNDIKSSDYFPLLKYLVRNGYIDETYSDYMTYFYENSISKEDKTFLRSVADKKAKEYSYRLRDVGKVASRMSEADFAQLEVLNFDLVVYLLENKNHKKYLNKIILQLKESKNYPFIIAFWGFNKKRELFTKELNSHWPELFSLMFIEGNFTKAIIRDYSLLTICNSSDEEIMNVNKNSILADHISENPSYLDIEIQQIYKIIYVFKLIHVSFVSLEYKDSYKDLFNEVYTNSLYVINAKNISLILEVIFNIESARDISIKNFSLIYENKNSSLYEYIINNFATYIDTLLSTYSEFYDNEEAFLFILNTYDITEEVKNSYINLSNTIVNYIDTVTQKNLWEALIDRKLFALNAENIINYFSFNASYDEALIKFINESDVNINFADYPLEEQCKKFFISTVTCNELSNEKYSSILNQLKYTYNISIPISIDKDKVDILIDLKIFKMTKDILFAIRKSYKENLSHFILNNTDDYLSLIDDKSFDGDELLIILSSAIPDKQKLYLLNFEKGPLSIFGENYSDVIVEHILTKNLDSSEFQIIFDSYSLRSSNIKNIIRNIVLSMQHDISAGNYSLPVALYDDLFHQDNVAAETKTEFFICLLPSLNAEECKTYLAQLSMSNFLNIFTNKRPKFIINDMIQRILTVFKEKKWIRDFAVDESNANFFKVYKPRVD